MNSHRHALATLGLCAALVAAAGCGAAKDPNAPPAGRGQLSLALVDAPRVDATEIWVNVTRITAHSTTAGWVTIVDQPFSVDLLTLKTDQKALGLVNLPPGTVTQIRLIVADDGNQVVFPGSTTPVTLKVPSGSESGIKISGPWDVVACSRASVVLDFDGQKSIFAHATADGTEEWILRPVIHVKHAEATAVGCTDGDVPPAVTTPPSCDATNPCAAGELCVAGSCTGGAGAACTMGGECFSSSCDPTNHCAAGGQDAPCVAAKDCLSASCTDGKCTPGAAGVPCSANGDCASGACTLQGVGGTCAPGGAGGAGAPCTAATAATDCLSNSCIANLCQPGGQGAPCGGNADCDATVGLACISSYCQLTSAM